MAHKNRQENNAVKNSTSNLFLDTLCYSGVSHIAYPQIGASTAKDSQVIFEEYVLFLIRKYDREALLKKIAYNVLQIIVFICAAIATILISFSKLIPAILTGIVTIATAITNLYKFGENSQSLERVAEDLAIEYNRHKTKRGIYKGKSEEVAFCLFMDRIESLVLERRQRANALSEMKKIEIV